VGRYPLYALDVVVWIIMIIIIAAALLIINQGEMRVYVFLALLTGGLVYYKWVSQYTQPTLYVLGRATAYMLKAVWANLTRPMVWTIIWLRTRSLRKQAPPPDDSIE
jgi:spore cortex biosynthesis protein YabQ